jgi:hypothetical protein
MRFQGAFRCCGLMYWACWRRPHDLDVLDDEICSLWFVAGASRAVLIYERVVPFISIGRKERLKSLRQEANLVHQRNVKLFSQCVLPPALNPCSLLAPCQ